MFKVSPISLHTSPQPFSKHQECLIDGVLWQTVPYDLQHNLEFSLIGWFRHVVLICCQHQAPDPIEWMKTWGIWQPLVFTDKIRSVSGQPILYLPRRMSRRTVLLKHKVVLKQMLTVLQKQWKQICSVITGINFSFVGYKIQPSLPTVASTSRNHNIKYDVILNNCVHFAFCNSRMKYLITWQIFHQRSWNFP